VTPEDTPEAAEVAHEQSFAAAEARKALTLEMGKKPGFADPEGVHNGGSFVLKDIQPLKALFQPREEFEGHIEDLQDALKRNGALDPILVGWTGRKATIGTPPMSAQASGSSRLRWSGSPAPSTRPQVLRWPGTPNTS
jgi:hypothetical protein